MTEAVASTSVAQKTLSEKSDAAKKSIDGFNTKEMTSGFVQLTSGMYSAVTAGLNVH